MWKPAGEVHGDIYEFHFYLIQLFLSQNVRRFTIYILSIRSSHIDKPSRLIPLYVLNVFTKRVHKLSTAWFPKLFL